MKDSNNQPEVIDPDDPRYRRPDDFNRNHGRDSNQDMFDNRYLDSQRGGRHFYYRSYGCTPIGCFPGCLISLILSILLTFMLNMFFW
ncbi:hypothetical protein J8H63_02320 [Staphylococcus chromogenes]|uniref:hypothetical protein n=1 Tax=Staphylococcus chromogenes TaxID=46126 RepID=UPI000CD0849B|nr:hypothetical protein [Staphylococcus chromogenes]MBP0045402.1 hypothetical protein [Staphylococcus chromogenes]PNY96400.1 hypothetical protein CD151_03210 [Staphylococcus chromogenes]GGI30061.1 hypothetical protein GCM10008139_02430 [Staphylococcus chromogenes]SUM13819.1 Uncharacterised protein [Staphylococcus chromogenes]